jgi:hypothetical protein
MLDEKRYYCKENWSGIIEFPAKVIHYHDCDKPVYSTQSKLHPTWNEVDVAHDRQYQRLDAVIAEAAIRDWERQRKEREHA